MLPATDDDDTNDIMMNAAGCHVVTTMMLRRCTILHFFQRPMLWRAKFYHGGTR